MYMVVLCCSSKGYPHMFQAFRERFWACHLTPVHSCPSWWTSDHWCCVRMMPWPSQPLEKYSPTCYWTEVRPLGFGWKPAGLLGILVHNVSVNTAILDLLDWTTAFFDRRRHISALKFAWGLFVWTAFSAWMFFLWQMMILPSPLSSCLHTVVTQ